MSVGKSIGVIVLAAGAGTRMQSDLPKPLHQLAGLPMIEYVLRSAAKLSPLQTVVVASPEFAELAVDFHLSVPFTTVLQSPPRGTGDAVKLALPLMANCDLTLVLYADHPLIDEKTLARLLHVARSEEHLVTVLTCVLPSGGPYGRIVRDRAGHPVAIAELKSDDQAARAGASEINSGIMALDTQWATAALGVLGPDVASGEYYLTDLVACASAAGTEEKWPVGTVSADPEVLVGINDRVELASADGIMRRRINQRHMLAGVTMIGPETTFVDEDVEIGRDTVLEPHCVIRTGCRIGSKCRIGPGTLLERVVVADSVQIESSTVSGAFCGEASHVGPYSQIRGGSTLHERVHVGNFAEINRSQIGSDVKIGHFSYVGDASIGSGTNVGAGSVTCNFDGTEKHRTEIGRDVFVGSGSMLVAPLHIGDGARTGAGSVVTKDVSPGAIVVGVPARPIGQPRQRSSVSVKGEE